MACPDGALLAIEWGAGKELDTAGEDGGGFVGGFVDEGGDAGLEGVEGVVDLGVDTLGVGFEGLPASGTRL